MGDLQMKKMTRMIKMETRLTSLANDRNLTLGGNKAKKQYAPNLNPVRNKNKEKEVARKVLEKNRKIIAARKSKHTNDPGRYVQSQGTFSEGAGELKKNISYGGGGGGGYQDREYNGKGSGGGDMAMPKLEKNSWDINVQAEANVIDDLLSINEDLKPSEMGSREYEPVILPLHANDKPFLDNFCVNAKRDTLKKEPVIKQETTEYDCGNILQDPTECWNIAPSFLTSDNFDDHNLNISLIKLPDTFAAKGFTADDQETDFTASRFPVEGQIGKILVRQSGRMEAYIGRTLFLIDSAESGAFTEEVMTLPTVNPDTATSTANSTNTVTDKSVNASDSRSVNASDKSVNITESSEPMQMISLGSIHEKLTMTPSWQKLFTERKRPK